MPQIFETLMIVCFGMSWPAALYKSYKSKTTRGKSIIFLFCVWVGYVFGIISKLTSGNVTYVLVFYCINLTMVAADIVLYFINLKREKENAGAT